MTGSYALNTGTSTVCAAAVGSPGYGAGGVDQRGMPRPAPAIGVYCDIGAYQRGVPSAISAVGGTPQSAQIDSAFAAPLQARVTDSVGGPLDAVNVVFAGPVPGAGITSGGTIATNTNGIANLGVTANSTAGGPYTVTAITGAFTTTFSLTNFSPLPPLPPSPPQHLLHLPLLIR